MLPCVGDISAVVNYVGKILNVARILVPIAIIIMASIDLAKAMMAQNEDEMKKSTNMLVKRFIFGVLIFFVPSIVSIIFGLINVDVDDVIYACDNIERTSRLESYFNTSYEVDNGGNPVPNTGTYTAEPNNSSSGNNQSENKPNNGESELNGSGTSGQIMTPKTLTIATWNVGHGTKVSGVSANDFANKLKSEGVTLAGLQEVKSKSGDKRSLTNNIASLSGLKSTFYTEPANASAIVSNIKFISTHSYTLKSCGESRAIQKAIININGVDISFYNTHLSYQKGCSKKQMIDINNKLKSDPNPIILVGDFNVARSCNIIVDNLDAGYEIISYDTVNSGIKCTDSIIINGKGHIKVENAYARKTKDILTDHNMVLAKLTIY